MGPANGGGSSGNGTVFAVNTDGTGFTNLYSFTAGLGSSLYQPRRIQSICRLDLIGQHPVWDDRWVAAVRAMARCSPSTPNGTGFTNLYSFSATSGPSLTNSDGASPRCRIDSIGQHSVWDRRQRRQFGLWHGVQSFVPAAATGDDPFRSKCNSDVADQCRRVHFAIHHEPCSTGGLEHQLSWAGRCQRAEYRYQFYLWNTKVLSARSVGRKRAPLDSFYEDTTLSQNNHFRRQSPAATGRALFSIARCGWRRGSVL